MRRALNKQALQEAPSTASLKSLDRAALCAGPALLFPVFSVLQENSVLSPLPFPFLNMQFCLFPCAHSGVLVALQ